MVSQDSIIVFHSLDPESKGEAKSLETGVETPVLFEITESQNTWISYSGKKYDVYVENNEREDEIALSSGNRLQINDKLYPNVPFFYRIRVVNKESGNERILFYRVKPEGSVDDAQFQRMVSTISEWDEKLIYEPDAKFQRGKRVFNHGFASLQTLIRELNGNFGDIKKALILLETELFYEDRRVVEKGAMNGKVTSRSIIKNSRSFASNRPFVSRIKNDVDTPFNRYIIAVLCFCYRRLSVLIKESITAKEAELDIQTALKQLKDQADNSDKWVSYGEKRFNISRNKTKSLELFIKNAEITQAFISKNLNEGPLSNVRLSECEKIIYRRERPLFRRNVSLIESKLFVPMARELKFVPDLSCKAILSTPLKRTSKLFENYVLHFLFEAIENLGFIRSSSEPLKDKVAEVFSKGSDSFELFYGIDAIDISSVHKNQLFYFGELIHISPDFFVLFKKAGHPFRLLVLDAKCSRTSTLNRHICKGNDTYRRTIRDYLSLRYAQEELRPLKDSKTVDSLWFVFPEDGNTQKYDPIDNLEYAFEKMSMDGHEVSFVERFKSFFTEVDI